MKKNLEYESYVRKTEAGFQKPKRGVALAQHSILTEIDLNMTMAMVPEGRENT